MRKRCRTAPTGTPRSGILITDSGIVIAVPEAPRNLITINRNGRSRSAITDHVGPECAEGDPRGTAEDLKESRDELAAIIERGAEARRVEAFFADAEQRVAQLDDTEAVALRNRLRRARDLLGGVADALERVRQRRTPDVR